MVEPARLIVGAVLSATVGLVPGLTVPAGRSETPPPPSVAKHLGPPPGNCPRSNRSMIHVGYSHNSRERIEWVGQPPLWGHSNWMGRTPTLPVSGIRTKYGYYDKVFWQVTQGTPFAVTLRGWNLQTGQAVWFGKPLSNEGLRRLIAYPLTVETAHSGMPFTFVPSAGCYVLFAQWRSGAWIMPFVAGCVAGFC